MAKEATTPAKPAKKAPAKKAEKSLQEQLAEARHDLLEAKKAHRAGELVNPRVFGGYRKKIAQIMTKINAEKEGK